MTDPTDVVARIEATFPVEFGEDFGEGDVFRLILDEEGSQALVQAVLDAAAPTPANEPHNQWYEFVDNDLTPGLGRLRADGDVDVLRAEGDYPASILGEVLAALNAGSLDVTAPTGPTEPQCGWCGGKGYVLSNGMVAKRVPCGCAPTGPTGHDTPTPTAEQAVIDAAKAFADDRNLPPLARADVNTRIRMVDALVAAVEALFGRTATPDPGDIVPVQHTEQVPWHAASGRRLASTGRRIWQVNFGDAGEVFYRLESPDGRRQYASYDADDGMVEVLSDRTATPDPGVEVSSGSENRHAMKHLPPDQDHDLPPGVEQDGDGWVLRQGNPLPQSWRWRDIFREEWCVPSGTHPVSVDTDVPVRPVASITEEPTDG